LLVEDEIAIRDSVEAYLHAEGYLVRSVGDGRAAVDAFSNGNFQLVILDLMLPGITGEEVIRFIRDRSNVPVIMLTAKTSVDNRIDGLELGADDYVPKPFSPRELMARVRALIRRSRNSTEPQRDVLEFDGLIIDVPTHQVSVDGHDVKLTQSEFDLLLTLARFPGRVYQRMELIEKAFGYDYEGYERTVDSHMKNLRAKLGDNSAEPRWLFTVHGIGYRFMKPNSAVKPSF